MGPQKGLGCAQEPIGHRGGAGLSLPQSPKEFDNSRLGSAVQVMMEGHWGQRAEPISFADMQLFNVRRRAQIPSSLALGTADGVQTSERASSGNRAGSSGGGSGHLPGVWV